MAKITFGHISSYIEKLRSIYQSIDEGLFKNEIIELNKTIELLNSIQKGSLLPTDLVKEQDHQQKPKLAGKPRENTKEKSNIKLNKFDQGLKLLSQGKYNELKGTKLNYEEITKEEDVVQFLEETTDSQVLNHATAIDLKLLYCILTGETVEIKGKNKKALLQTIKLNIHAARRGAAFTKTK
ncbi:hypothetical protein [Bacillus sp. AK128]